MSLEKAIKNLIDYKTDLDDKITDIALKISSLATYDDIIENTKLLLNYTYKAHDINKMICDLDEIEKDGDDNDE